MRNKKFWQFGGEMLWPALKIVQKNLAVTIIRCVTIAVVTVVVLSNYCQLKLLYCYIYFCLN